VLLSSSAEAEKFLEVAAEGYQPWSNAGRSKVDFSPFMAQMTPWRTEDKTLLGESDRHLQFRSK
jgi:hypothetical protein